MAREQASGGPTRPCVGKEPDGSACRQRAGAGWRYCLKHRRTMLRRMYRDGYLTPPERGPDGAAAEGE